MAADGALDAKLYVILGSHACRTGMLLLEHKGIPYRKVEIPTGLHPLAVRLLGFPGRTERDFDDGRKTFSLALANRMGTVPALRIGGKRVQTNRAIARHLDQIQPDPPLFPAEPDLRREVEAAELWGDQTLQMVVRRTALAAISSYPRERIREATDDGRLGPILFRNSAMRLMTFRAVGRMIFEIEDESEFALLSELPSMLDRVDGWIDAGVLNGESLNAADYMIVSSLAVLTYRDDLRPEVESRPLGRLVDRVLPAPV